MQYIYQFFIGFIVGISLVALMVYGESVEKTAIPDIQKPEVVKQAEPAAHKIVNLQKKANAYILK